MFFLNWGTSFFGIFSGFCKSKAPNIKDDSDSVSYKSVHFHRNESCTCNSYFQNQESKFWFEKKILWVDLKVRYDDGPCLSKRKGNQENQKSQCKQEKTCFPHCIFLVFVCLLKSWIARHFPLKHNRSCTGVDRNKFGCTYNTISSYNFVA